MTSTVVVPCAIVTEGEIGSSSWLLSDEWQPDEGRRQFLLYFGGSSRLDDESSSGGARQAFHAHVIARNDPRVKIGGSLAEYR